LPASGGFIRVSERRENRVKEIEKFLRPNPTIDCDNESVKQKAASLTRGHEKSADKAKSLFYWVRDEIQYQPVVPPEVFEDYRASKTLERGKGFCVEKAALLTALSRAAGIPARMHFADIRNHLVPEKLTEVMKTNLFVFHGYSELFIDGKWVKATPAFDLKMCREKRFKPVEFDAKQDAIFPSHDLDGQLHIEYVKDRGYYEDVPMDDLLTIWLDVYSPEVIERAIQYIEEERAQGGSRWSS